MSTSKLVVFYLYVIYHKLLTIPRLAFKKLTAFQIVNKIKCEHDKIKDNVYK